MTWMWLFPRCWIWQGPHCQYCRVTCSLGQDFPTYSAFSSGKFISLGPCTSSNLFWEEKILLPDIRNLMKDKINSNYHSPCIKPQYLGSKCLELEASSYIWGSSLSYTSHFCSTINFTNCTNNNITIAFWVWLPVSFPTSFPIRSITWLNHPYLFELTFLTDNLVLLIKMSPCRGRHHWAKFHWA